MFFIFQIRIDDCVKALKEYVEQGRTFDYVINDLTDIPIAVSLHGKCIVKATSVLSTDHRFDKSKVSAGNSRLDPGHRSNFV